ncbi:DoxX family membrane protein [Gordonia sp. NPDC003376]
MSERDQSGGGRGDFRPSSPYDEPTEAFAVPPRPADDRDSFYDRHHVSRVDHIDDLDPDEVATRQFDLPPVGRPRNPVPLPPVTGADEAPTVPTPAQPSRSTPPGEPPTPIPSVEDTFPELAKPRRDPVPDDEATAAEPVVESHPTMELTAGDPEYVDDGEPTSQLAAPRRDDIGHGVHPDHADDTGQHEAAIATAPRGTLDLGLLILRLGVGVVAVAHGLQKLFGWWGGPGLDGFQAMLTNSADPAIGFDADYTRVLAIVGAVSETAGGVLVILGLLTPIGASALVSVMLLAATYRVTLSGGFQFFAAAGGVEYELLLLVAAAALILTGPGTYSLDRTRKWARRPFLGSVAWLIIGIAAAVAVWILCNGANPFQAA